MIGEASTPAQRAIIETELTPPAWDVRAVPQAKEVTHLYRQAAMAGIEDVICAILKKLKEEGWQEQAAR